MNDIKRKMCSLIVNNILHLKRVEEALLLNLRYKFIVKIVYLQLEYWIILLFYNSMQNNSNECIDCVKLSHAIIHHWVVKLEGPIPIDL